ncbi:hypothetical protein CQ476_06 [TM7 phage DolZOral124_53_65]|nr:hypothetical protein CQ476_06 [TM7 phage DolZOral124_53_65]
MPPDLASIAEEALEKSEQGEAQDDEQDQKTDDAQDEGGQQTQEADDDATGGDEDENGSEEGQTSEEDDEAEGQSEEEDESDEGDGAQGKKAQDLTDEELLAELEKRGKKVDPEPKEEKKEEPAPQPTEVPDEIWSQMNDFQRTVYNELPYMEIRDKDGNTHRVKHDSQVPEDFEWANEQQKHQFYSVQLPAQSVLAERIGGKLYERHQQEQQQQQSQAEADEVVKGIDALVQQGIVPKIAAQPGTQEFDQDPGVQRANDILALRREYLAKGEKISVETAGRIFKAEHPDLYQKKPTKSPADKERKAASSIVYGGGRGTSGDAKSVDKPKVFPVGTSAEDIADYYSEILD